MTNIETLSAEMKEAFDTLAARSGQAIIYSGFQDPKEGRNLLERCGTEVERLLLNKTEKPQQLEASNALIKLTGNDASLLDIAEFMYVCTAGWGSSAKHILETAGFTSDKLKQMARKARELAEDVKRLNHPGLPGPLAIFKYQGKLGRSERYVFLFEALPGMLTTSAEIVEHWPFPGSGYDLPHRQYGKHFLLAYFQAYLKRFGGNYDDLSGLVRLMRDVRFAASPEALRLLRSKGGWQKAAKQFPFTRFAKDEDNQDQKKKHQKKGRTDVEPLSAKALQMAVDRFRKRYPRVGKRIPVHIDRYLTDRTIQSLRKKDKTLTFLKAFEYLLIPTK